MNKSIYNIMLDLQSPVARDALYIRQGDSMRTIVVAIADGGVPYDLMRDTNTYAELIAKLPDGSIGGIAMTVENNTLTAVIPYEWVATAGEVWCEIKVRKSHVGEALTTPRFSLLVTETFSGYYYAYYNKSVIQAYRPWSALLITSANYSMVIDDDSNAFIYMYVPKLLVPTAGVTLTSTDGSTFTLVGEQDIFDGANHIVYNVYKSNAKTTSKPTVTVTENTEE